MLENEEAAQRLFGNRFCFPQAFVVASLSALICVKSFLPFLADLRRFIFSLIYADFLCFTLTFSVLLSASICVKSYSFLADLR
jgi:hypothetical protein